MSFIVRLQNLPLVANSGDIRKFFGHLHIPEGGVHILGGKLGDTFIVFESEEDVRIAMQLDNHRILGARLRLSLSNYDEMKYQIERITHRKFVGIGSPNTSVARKLSFSPEQFEYTSRKDKKFHDERVRNSIRICRLRSPVKESEYYLEKVKHRQAISPERHRTKHFRSHSSREEAHSSRRKSRTPDSPSHSPRRQSPFPHKKFNSSHSRSSSPRARNWRKSQSPQSGSHSPSWHKTKSHRPYRESVSPHAMPLSPYRTSKLMHYSAPKRKPSPHHEEELFLEESDHSSRLKRTKMTSFASAKERSTLLKTKASYGDFFPLTPHATIQSSISESLSYASDFQNDAKHKKLNLTSMKLPSEAIYDVQSLSDETAKMDFSLDPQALLEKRITDALNFGYDSRLKAEFNALHDIEECGVSDLNNVCKNILDLEKHSTPSSNFHEMDSSILADHSHDSTYFQSPSVPDLSVEIQDFPSNLCNAYTKQDHELSIPLEDTEFSEPKYQSNLLHDYNHQKPNYRGFIMLLNLPPDCTLKDIRAMFKGIYAPHNNVRWILDNRGKKTGAAILKLKKRDFYRVIKRRNVIYNGLNISIKPCPRTVYQTYFLANEPESAHSPSEEKELCYMLKGLPFTATQEDIRSFFDGILIDEIYIIYKSNGKATGTGFVTFPNLGNFIAAGENNGKNIGRRYIEMFPSTISEMVEAKKKNGDLKFDKSAHSKRSLCALLTGLPMNITTTKVSSFFSMFGLRPDCIHITLNDNHQPNGRAFVEFTNILDFDAALKCHGNHLDGNPICVKQILFDEMIKILEKQNAKHGFGELQPNAPSNLPEKVPYLWDPTDEVVEEMTIAPKSQAALSENMLSGASIHDNKQSTKNRKSTQNCSNLIECKITDDIILVDENSRKPYNVKSKDPKEVSKKVSPLPLEKQTDCKIIKNINSKQTVKTEVKEKKPEVIFSKECRAEKKMEIPGLTLVADMKTENDDDVVIIENYDPYVSASKVSLQKNSSSFPSHSQKDAIQSKDSMLIPKVAVGLKSILKSGKSAQSNDVRNKFNQKRYFHSEQDDPQRNAVEYDCEVQLSNVPAFIDTDGLVEFFHGFKILKEHSVRRFTESGEPTGDVRVTFPGQREAEKAMAAMNGRLLGGKPISMFLFN